MNLKSILHSFHLLCDLFSLLLKFFSRQSVKTSQINLLYLTALQKV